MPLGAFCCTHAGDCPARSSWPRLAGTPIDHPWFEVCSRSTRPDMTVADSSRSRRFGMYSRDSWMTPLLVTPGVAVTLLVFLGGEASSGFGSKVFTAWGVWILTALACGSRTVWQRGFAQGGSRLQRTRYFIGFWYGWVGLATTALVVFAEVVFAPLTWLTPSVYGIVAACAVVALVIRPPVRHVASGVLISALGPAWILIAFAAVVVVTVPAIVYLVTVGVSAVWTRRTRSSAVTDRYSI